MAFSTSSLTAEAGRSTTSPAAMRLTRTGGSWRMAMPAIVPCRPLIRQHPRVLRVARRRLRQARESLADGLLRPHHPGVWGGAGAQPAGVARHAPSEKRDGGAGPDDLSFTEARSPRRRLPHGDGPVARAP